MARTKFVAAMLTVPARDLLQRISFQRSLDLNARVTQSHVVIAALALADEHAEDHRRLIARLMEEGDTTS